jgi:hypothetical protein
LTDSCWSAFPARCRHCSRLFCEKEVATCSFDLTVELSTPKYIRGLATRSGNACLESKRQVALITCVFCAGRKSFLEDREVVFKRMSRKIFGVLLGPRLIAV